MKPSDSTQPTVRPPEAPGKRADSVHAIDNTYARPISRILSRVLSPPPAARPIISAGLSDRESHTDATGPPAASILEEAQKLIHEHSSWCRILHSDTRRLGFGGEQLWSETLAQLDGFNFFPVRTVQEMRKRIEHLKGHLPTLAVVQYHEPGGAGDWEVEWFQANDLLCKFLRDEGVILVMDIGDPISRAKSELFYSRIRELNIQAIICHDRACGALIMEEFDAKGIRNVRQMIWMPWFMDRKVHRDYGLPITRTFLFVGRPDEPLRRKVIHYGRWANLMTLGRFDFEVHGWAATHEDFARRLNSSLASFSTPQGSDTYKGHPIGHTIPKYFEIPGCRTLLLAKETPDMPALGFQDEVNFIGIRPDNFRSVMNRVRLDRKKAYLHDIAVNGYDLVHRHHTSEQRVACLFGDLIQFAAKQEGKAEIAKRVDEWTRARRPWLAGNH